MNSATDISQDYVPRLCSRLCYYFPTMCLEQFGIVLRNNFQQHVHNVLDERESNMSLLLHH